MTSVWRGRVTPQVVARLRWVYLAPLLAMVTFGAWALASPVGAGPDDDFHLASVWCTFGGSQACDPGSEVFTRELSTAFRDSVCYARDQTESAACQDEGSLALDGPKRDTDRGNFQRDYPPLFYGAQRLFAGNDLVASALIMRLANAALFVGLTTALAALSTTSRRQTLVWGWLVTLVPLGLFIIPSNNPSGWAVTGVGTAYIAALGWFETDGRRRWAFGFLYAAGVLMAAGSRADAGLYVIGASGVAGIMTMSLTKQWAWRAILPAAGILVALVLFAGADTAGAAVEGVSGTPSSGGGGAPAAAQASQGTSLLIYNLLQLPDLWTGVWGTWGLGWLDTPVPAIVPWSMVAVFVAVAFAGVAHLHRRKAFTLLGVLAVLTIIPVYLLVAGGNTVGEVVQPRYVLPVIVLFALVLVTATPGARALRLTRVQHIAVFASLGAAHTVALQANVRRYVTGTDQQGVNLDAGAEWWWQSAPIGPTAVWAIGSLAFVALLVTLWPLTRRKEVASGPSKPQP